jgi:hypothetical protein
LKPSGRRDRETGQLGQEEELVGQAVELRWWSCHAVAEERELGQVAQVLVEGEPPEGLSREMSEAWFVEYVRID